MSKEENKEKIIIPNNKRRFYSRKYPIAKTKFVIFGLAIALLIWNGLNVFKPDETFSDYYDQYLKTGQTYDDKFVPNSIVNYFKGDVNTMTRQDCYKIMDKNYEDSNITPDTASHLCQVVIKYAKSNPKYGKINCQDEQWFKLEEYYFKQHPALFEDGESSLKSIKKTSKTRNIQLFVYDIFSFCIFVKMVVKINLNRIYLPSFFSIINTQAHYNIVKILKKKQSHMFKSSKLIRLIECIFDWIFLIYFLYNTFVFPFYVIGQIGTVFKNAQYLCDLKQDSLKEYQSNLKQLMDSAIQEQQRSSNILNSSFISQQDNLKDFLQQCNNSSNVVFYLFSSVRQTLVSIQLMLIIIKAILNIITILKKYCSHTFINYYELRKDLKLHSVPFVKKEEIIPISDDPSSVILEDYEEDDSQSTTSENNTKTDDESNQISSTKRQMQQCKESFVTNVSSINQKDNDNSSHNNYQQQKYAPPNTKHSQNIQQSNDINNKNNLFNQNTIYANFKLTLRHGNQYEIIQLKSYELKSKIKISKIKTETINSQIIIK